MYHRVPSSVRLRLGMHELDGGGSTMYHVVHKVFELCIQESSVPASKCGYIGTLQCCTVTEQSLTVGL